MKLFSLALLSYVATAQEVSVEEPEERGKYNPGSKECGGVAIKDKMNGDDELNFLCKSTKDKSGWSTMCRGTFKTLSASDKYFRIILTDYYFKSNAAAMQRGETDKRHAKCFASSKTMAMAR